jgi:hypothetical protein
LVELIKIDLSTNNYAYFPVSVYDVIFILGWINLWLMFLLFEVFVLWIVGLFVADFKRLKRLFWKYW